MAGTSWKWSTATRRSRSSSRTASSGRTASRSPVDVVYSLTAGKQDKAMDIIGLYRTGSNIVSIAKVAALASGPSTARMMSARLVTSSGGCASW